ncbi:hypothetical protein CS542_09540 [Pedobacter sp. IW39]|nr:hypothetical protein CS542_09540 [Pedobacter sp. IW39]
MGPLHQHIQHYRIYNNNHYKVGEGDVDVMLAFQQNVRREYNHRLCRIRQNVCQVKYLKLRRKIQCA